MKELTSTKAVERLVRTVSQVLAVVSFVLLCWVAHRALEVRTDCITSSFIHFIQIGERRVDNCRYQSRISLSRFWHPLSAQQASAQYEIIQKLEVLEPLTPLFNPRQPELAVEINLSTPHIFENGRGYIRLGQAWLTDPLQTQRALVLGLLKNDRSRANRADETGEFELEVITDFLISTVMDQNDWQGHSFLREVKFPTSAPSFTEYCKSPFRSLAHAESCALNAAGSGGLASDDPTAGLWGFRPLMAAALRRVFSKTSMAGKLNVLQAIRSGHDVQTQAVELPSGAIESKVRWFERSLNQNVTALNFPVGSATDSAVKSTLKELDVGSPTHWELTVDITNTPAWKEILEQFRTWTKLHPLERTLIFTPEGALAFPSGLPVKWASNEVQSQKHVLIACHWPKAKDILPVVARHMYARQFCGKVDEVFWN